jgi:choline dehydrogenase-like flavoprotein
LILDLRSIEDGRTLEVDLCIVGSGPAGLATALELANSPLRVAVLEAGGNELEADTQSLYDAEIAGAPYTGAHDGRARTFGGTSTLWAGQALPLTRDDFLPRRWVPYSGWPITYDELVPYYERAMRFLRLDASNFDSDLFRRFGVEPPRFNADQVRYHYSKWCRTPDLRVLYKRTIVRARNITLVLHANVDTIALDETGQRVSAIEAQTLEGKRVRALARFVVLCCGGLETPRLLLHNTASHRRGIGNGNDLVGRFLQDHPAAVAGTVAPNDADEFQRLFNLRNHRGIKYSVRCSASPMLQRTEEILSASASIMFVPPPESPFAKLKSVYHRVRRGKVTGHVLWDAISSVVGSPKLIRPIAMYTLAARTYTPGASLQLIVQTEQTPRPDCRVTLSDSRDRLGMRKLRIEWSVDDLALRTARVFADTLRRQFAAVGLGSVSLADWVCATGDEGKTTLTDVYHPIGTTRMGLTARDGVVDEHCRVHGVENLYVAGSSVFPTGGHSNPTLTLIALAIRTADRIQSLLRPS